MSLKYGSMYFFSYNDPKTKARLKEWDKRPLVVPLYITHKHLLGINIHWVPKMFRLQFINWLLEESKKTKNKRKLARTTYLMIKKNRRLKPALLGIRKYINKRMTNVQEIPREKVGKWMLINPKYFAKKVKGGLR